MVREDIRRALSPAGEMIDPDHWRGVRLVIGREGDES